ncbi:MAG: carboxy-S-adenosyl-L-methionine synthase CmoA [Cellvibrionaceae bacterium]
MAQIENKAQKDKVYADPLAQVGQFRFDDKVASVFEDMIQRSVPGYGTILTMIGDITERYAQENSQCYDLGCSLGAATLAMRHKMNASGCRIVSIDNSEAMIMRCKSAIDLDSASHPDLAPVTLHCNDLQSITIEQASVVVLNFTLQFIPMEERQAIIQSIYDGLLPGGILLISEKVIFEDAPHQSLLTELYHNFKRNNGYSDLEIAQKRTALEEVLTPETIDTHKQRLKKAGFSSVDVWFQCLTFASFIAIKH